MKKLSHASNSNLKKRTSCGYVLTILKIIGRFWDTWGISIDITIK